MRLARRIFCTMLSLAMMMVATVAFADYPTYLNGDTNYICVDGHMGTGWYVDRSSLNVQSYNPPQYIIAVNVVTARSADGSENGLYHGGQGKITGVRTYRYFYNYDYRNMYVDKNTGSGNWRYLNPNGSWAETGIVMPAGEMAFYLAYGIPFYGIYSNSFYAAAN